MARKYECVIIAFPHGIDSHSRENRSIALEVYRMWEGFNTLILTDLRVETIPAPTRHMVQDIHGEGRSVLDIEEMCIRSIDYIEQYEPLSILLIALDEFLERCVDAFHDAIRGRIPVAKMPKISARNVMEKCE